MKKNFYPVISLIMIMFIIVCRTTVLAHSNGAPAGYTGSPGDGHTCTSCHGGSASTVSGYFTTDIPPSGYVAGATYNITVTFTGSGGKGFELSPQNPSGTQLGTLIPGSGSKLVGGTKYCTHSTKQTSGTATWTFTWTAPAAGTGDVTFYGAFAITEGTTHKETVTVAENSPLALVVSATPSSLCSGGSTQLNAAVTGGSGSYTYNWSSVPAGFTSSIQNPVATPAANTTYIVEVGDGTSTLNDSVDVTVQAAPEAYAGKDTMVCEPTVQIPLSGTASNYTSILWSTSGDGTFSNTASLQTTYYPGTADRNSMNVDVTLTANAIAPCTGSKVDVKHITFIICDGVPVFSREGLSFSLWPNPSSGRITLSVSKPSAIPVSIIISDLTGISRYSETIDSQELSISRSLDLGSLSAGIYLVKIECGTNARVQKLVIL